MSVYEYWSGIGEVLGLDCYVSETLQGQFSKSGILLMAQLDRTGKQDQLDG